MLLIFLDTETTGLDPNRHRVIEIAFKIFETLDSTWVTSYSEIVAQPLEVIAEATPKSLEVNGFTQEMILTGKTESAVAAEIMNDFGRAHVGDKEGIFICQNPSFDRVFFNQLISTEFQTEAGWPYHWLDLASMFWAKKLLIDKDDPALFKEKDFRKNAIAKALSLPEEVYPHRAMNGTEHLIACYQALFGHLS